MIVVNIAPHNLCLGQEHLHPLFPSCSYQQILVAIWSLLLKWPSHSGLLLCEAFLTPPAPANCFLIPVSTLPGTHHSVWSSVHLSPNLMDLAALGGQQLSQKDLLPPPHLAKCPSSVVWFSAPPQKVAKSAGFFFLSIECQE